MMVIRLFNVLVAALLRLTLPLYLQYRVVDVCAIVTRIYMTMRIACWSFILT